MTVKIVDAETKVEIVSERRCGRSLASLANEYNVSSDTISRIVKESPLSPVKIEDEVAPQNYMWNANSKFISITAGRKTWNADSEHTNFKAALQALVDDNVELALELINVEKAVKKFVKGNIVIQDGQLFYQGLELKSGLVNRILQRCADGEDFEFLLPFLENLLENPSRKTVERLFDFLEANDITITADGHFLAWKVVDSEFMDCRTRTFDNSPGQVVKMPRMLVTDDDQITCSSGLHVCSESYIKIYRGSSDKVVIVKVHPRDVVSIPVDYNNAKMRTCQYEVLSEATGK
ncbi:rIIB protector from prophage-induced early lysis [Yersinia phage phiR1-RT]|uniref:RIIB protector from prophage-induced early lysis n=1 Tax=Yersinia phage phiR1-RT TaxID=1206558 RepID=I7KQZ0_BPPR1|nr:RIIB lysis inhibitor [Yersinia phage phiR1-RT]CCI88580.1 rIIB protector from prophage-induced early lysis [Yersinia phage phiR1-RT]